MKEGKTEFYANTAKIVNKKMEGFYNPEMEYVRDLVLAVLKAWEQNDIRVSLPLAGTGIKALRILNELPKKKISYVYANDHDKTAYELMKKNKEKLNDERLFLANEEADEFLLYRKGFDYIDLDPYGSPNPYLDATIKRITTKGIIGITATDTKALAGSAKMGGLRKYGAYPIVGDHESGLRILIRSVIEWGSKYDKALIPIISVSNLHYYRIFFQVKKSKTICDELLKKEKIPLHNKEAKKIIKELKKINNNKLNDLLEEEIINNITDKNHVDIHKYCKKNNISQVPKSEKLIEQLKKKKYKACRSHISKTAIWTNANEKILKEIIK